MHNEDLIQSVMGVVGLLFLAAVSAFVMRRIRFPYTVGLVVVGVAIAFVSDEFAPLSDTLEKLKFGPAMILFLFIPILIFESAFNTDGRLLFKNVLPTMMLAAPGLLISTALVGLLVHAFTQLPLSSALIFGCLISATDPVAVIALFKELGVPKRLMVLVEGESIFNDATAIVTFQIILAVAALGIFDGAAVTSGIGSFFVVFFGGLFVGLGFGLILIKSIPHIGDEPVVHIAFTTVIAYGAFIVADHFLHTSGIMAVLGAGLVIGYYGPVRYNPRIQEELKVFWENAAFVANSLIFLMLGLSEKVFLAHIPANIGGLLVPAIIVILIVTAVRALVVFGLVPVVNAIPGANPVNLKYRTIMFWGGLRGAIAVALAMSLPAHFPFRWQIIDFTFAVILFTLLVNGTTMSWIIHKLGLDKPTPLDDYLKSFAEVAAKRAALKRLEKAVASKSAEEAVAEPVRQRYQEALGNAESHLEELRTQMGNDAESRKHLLWLRTLAILREVFHDRFKDGLLTLPAYRELEWNVRHEEQEIRRGDPIDVEYLMPPEKPVHHPLLRVLHQILPNLSQIQRWKRRRMGIMHEGSVAVRDAARTVLSRWEEIREFSLADSADLEECQRFFTQVEKVAGARIANLESEFTGAGRDLRERLLKKTCQDSERDAIRKLTHRGGLPDLIADQLERELDTPR